MNNNVRAGAGASEIVFSTELFPHEGFKGIHDNPNVRIIVIEKEETFIFAAYELVMLPDDLIDYCRKEIAEAFGVSADNVWLHVTHAITTPHAPGGERIGIGGHVIEQTEEEKKQGDQKRALYYEAIKTATARATENAVKSVSEAELAVGYGFSKVNCNRDIETNDGWWLGINPSGPSNREITVIKISDLSGTVKGILYSYALKPCAIDNSEMKDGNRLISSDIPGKACRILEEIYKAPVLFAMSAAGDQIPREMTMWEEAGDGMIRKIDNGLEEGLKIVEKLGTELANDIKIALESKMTELVVDEITLKKEFFEFASKQRIEMKPRKEYVFEEDGQTKSQPVLVAKLGKLAFAGCKPEVNYETEKELKEGSKADITLLVSMVNGGMKYMPDKASYSKVTWESQSSMFMAGAAEKFVETALEMINN